MCDVCLEGRNIPVHGEAQGNGKVVHAVANVDATHLVVVKVIIPKSVELKGFQQEQLEVLACQVDGGLEQGHQVGVVYQVADPYAFDVHVFHVARAFQVRQGLVVQDSGALTLRVCELDLEEFVRPERLIGAEMCPPHQGLETEGQSLLNALERPRRISLDLRATAFRHLVSEIGICYVRRMHFVQFHQHDGGISAMLAARTEHLSVVGPKAEQDGQVGQPV